MIRAGDQLLMVRDVWSWRWSLPSGPVAAGESPAAAAVRHTRALLGLEVAAEGEPIGPTSAKAPAIVTCRPLAPVPVLARQTLSIPDASRQGIAEARFLNPQQLAAEQWRYRSQRPVVQDLAAAGAAGADANTRLLAAQAQVPPLFAIQLAAVRGIQAHLRGLAVGLGMDFASGLGTLWTVTVVIAWLWQRRGVLAARRAFFFLAAATVLGYALKQACALPRPSFLDPSLARQTVYGFGFPSGHSITAASLAVALARAPCGRLQAAALAAGVFACGVARLWWGAHFPHDVLGGWALVGALAVVERRLPAPWGSVVLGGLAAASLVVAPTAAAVLVVAMAAGLLAGAQALAAAAPVALAAAWQPIGATALTLAATLATHLGWQSLRPAEGTFVACFAHLVAHFFSLGLVLALASRTAAGLVTSAHHHARRRAPASS